MIFDSDLRFFAPEVVQISTMDCGPAVLKSLLDGFGIPASYDRLRDACQTNVDGTSLDVIERVANELGLDARQGVLPLEHLLLQTTDVFPALAVTQLPDGFTHFVVAWRVDGNFVQIMDPRKGRRWQTRRQFLDSLYLHEQNVPAAAWREWAQGDGFCDPLRERLERLGVDSAEAHITTARAQTGWQPFAQLDAATRMVERLVEAQGVRRGAEAERLLQRTLDGAVSIPDRYHAVRAADGETIVLRGAVLMQVVGKSAEAPATTHPAAISNAIPSAIWLTVRDLLRRERRLTVGTLLAALLVASLGTTLEAIFFNSLLDRTTVTLLLEQNVGLIVTFVALLILLFLLRLPLNGVMQHIGRNFELRLRIRLLEKIPRLSDRYFHSRLIADLSQRAHEVRALRRLPAFFVGWLRTGLQLLLTIGGVIWLAPNNWPLALLLMGWAVLMSLVGQSVTTEQEMATRTHQSRLSRIYLDGLLGNVAVRAHSAEKTVEQQHEGLLVEATRARLRLLQTRTLITAVEMAGSTLLAVWMLMRSADASLLLIYWTLRLPTLAKGIVDRAMQLPMQRNRLARVLEPLNAPDENMPDAATDPLDGVAVEMRDVQVQVGTHPILHGIDVSIEAGEHVAIVGRSGAGKSTLVGLLLGWHRPQRGTLHVNGAPLDGERLQQLRQQTAWIDPTVQIWNQSLHDNLLYGDGDSNTNMLLTQADLHRLVERLPEGLHTALGEDGGLISEGEGQRVRLGRALNRPNAQLVILDEPFQGLDEARRDLLLQTARDCWRTATLLFVSHDIRATTQFERVLVIEDGRLIEDDHPLTLRKRPNSRYSQLFRAESALQKRIWRNPNWQRYWLADGRLVAS